MNGCELIVVIAMAAGVFFVGLLIGRADVFADIARDGWSSFGNRRIVGKIEARR